jgi:hypothetical protein
MSPAYLLHECLASCLGDSALAMNFQSRLGNTTLV